jgi:hypothetical protein
MREDEQAPDSLVVQERKASAVVCRPGLSDNERVVLLREGDAPTVAGSTRSRVLRERVEREMNGRWEARRYCEQLAHDQLSRARSRPP